MFYLTKEKTDRRTISSRLCRFMWRSKAPTTAEGREKQCNVIKCLAHETVEPT